MYVVRTYLGISIPDIELLDTYFYQTLDNSFIFLSLHHIRSKCNIFLVEDAKEALCLKALKYTKIQTLAIRFEILNLALKQKKKQTLPLILTT